MPCEASEVAVLSPSALYHHMYLWAFHWTSFLQSKGFAAFFFAYSGQCPCGFPQLHVILGEGFSEGQKQRLNGIYHCVDTARRQGIQESIQKVHPSLQHSTPHVHHSAV